MDELDIQVLLTLHKTKNITRAAEQLFMTQPALTKRLQNMEQDLGVPLTVRSRKGVFFTPQGEFAVEKMGRAAQELKSLRRDMPREEGIVAGELLVGVSLDYAWSRLPSLLEVYTRECPNVIVETTTAHSTMIYQMMQEDELDVAIVRGSFAWKEHMVELFHENVYRICSLDKVGVPWESYPFIGRKTNRKFSSRQAEWLAEQGLKPKRFMEADSIRTCAEMSQRGIGWSIVPEMALDNFTGFREPLYFRNGDPFLRHTYILCRDSMAQLPQVNEFIRIAQAIEQE